MVPIDKLSLLVTVAFSHFVFHEDLSKKAALGLAAMVAGTLVMLLPLILPPEHHIRTFAEPPGIPAALRV